MSRNDEIEDFDFQDIFLALDRHIRYKIYSTSDSEASVPSSSSSITSARAACLLLTLRVSRTGSKIASFRSRGPAGPSLPWIQYLITDKDRKATTTNHIFEAWTLILYSVCHSGTSLLRSGFHLWYANHNIIPYSCTYNKAKTSKIQQEITFSNPKDFNINILLPANPLHAPAMHWTWGGGLQHTVAQGDTALF